MQSFWAMKMIDKILFICFALLVSIRLDAQIRDIGVLFGVNVPLQSDASGGGVYEVNYGHFSQNGLGFRVGLRWTSEVAKVDNGFGLPLMLAYRTPSRNAGERFTSGLMGAFDGADDAYDTGEDRARGALGGLLMNLFSDMEFFAGVTPRFTSGASSSVARSSWGDAWQYWEERWTEKRRNASMTIDAGLRLNYGIGRFDIAVVPALHYDPTSQLVIHSRQGEEVIGVMRTTEQPIRWSFTLGAGLAFRF